MTINSNSLQSFTSLNGAIKVTKIDDTNSSSNKSNEAVSVNISTNATSNTTSLLNSLEEKTVIQARNGYVNLEEARQVKILEEHYSKMNEENKKFDYPPAHILDKYFDQSSPYYIQGLTKHEREIAYSAEIHYLKDRKMFAFADALLRNEPPLFGDVDVAEEKAYNREKVNGQFQSLLNKYNISIPKDTKLSFTIDPNTLKVTVTGTDDETLAKSIEDVINTADNAKQLFLHIKSSRSDDSSQYNGASGSKYSLVQTIKDATGYTLKDLEIKDGKFITPDGTDIAQLYAKKINENSKMPNDHKMMIISADTADLKKLAKNGFDSVPDLVLSIDYQNGSFYDVKQSENFGTEKNGWIKELKEARTAELMAYKNEEYQSQYLDTTQFTQKYNDIDLTSKKINIKNDEKEFLTKDELMLKYLLGNDEKSENDDFQEIIEKLQKINEQN
ncbi:hypothetical protein CKA55_12140 [Arcobacter suis]|uniref:DUF4885 domain-containing protein n=1 Tax=Arcobacter suis CECT 7833 TaxID=663365 RepID=A0AAD0ST27_9BACT|nr:DUF4885 family protein [Arcobacter suis]AXX90560.1 DUF4885 domain-containing protein [Arcobacter suis CECT 7833]RWS45572.1 hypothetical protein CKA55_12140 [Arcobacter suis]